MYHVLLYNLDILIIAINVICSRLLDWTLSIFDQVRVRFRFRFIVQI